MHSFLLPDFSGLKIESQEAEIETPGRSKPYTNKPGPYETPAPLRVNRRSKALVNQIEEQTGAYGELLRTIKQEVMTTFKEMLYISKCAAVHLDAPITFYDYLEKELAKPISWVQQAPFTLSGYLHPTRISEDKLLDFVNAYRSVRPAGTPAYKPSGANNLETLKEAYMIDQALAKHAEHFKPMVDALRGAGFVASDHNNEFMIKWRFQGARHAFASVLHMDNGRHSPYADESGEQLREWTETGTRCIATSGCVEATGRSSIYNCGTKVLSGVPVMTEQALKNITSTFLADARFSAYPSCKNPMVTRIQFTQKACDSTTTALDKYIASGKTFEEAGIQVLALKNGIISTYNDSVFHSGDNSTPDGFERCFFVACPVITNNHNKPIPFRLDAQLSDGSKLMFMYI